MGYRIFWRSLGSQIKQGRNYELISLFHITGSTERVTTAKVKQEPQLCLVSAQDKYNLVFLVLLFTNSESAQNSQQCRLYYLNTFIVSINFWRKFEFFQHLYFIVSFLIISYFGVTYSINLISEYPFLDVAWISKIEKILCTLISLEQIYSAYCFIKNGFVAQFSGQLL